MGPGDGGVVGEGEEEPERGEGAFVARSEEARVSEEAVRRRGEGYIYYVTYSRTHTRKGRGQQ